MAGTLRVSKALPQASADSVDTALRGGRYGETFVMGLPKNKYAYADEGSYYVATSVVDTAILATVSTIAYDPVASAFIYFNNTESVTGSAPKRVYLDFIKLLVKVIPASATELQFACHIDNGAATFTSGGTNITPVNVNGDVTASSVLGTTLWVGALTTTARTNGRLVARGRFKSFIPVIYDQYIAVFGNTEVAGGAVATGAGAAGTSIVGCPPIVIPPAWNFTFSLYGTATGAVAAQYLFEMGWWER